MRRAVPLNDAVFVVLRLQPQALRFAAGVTPVLRAPERDLRPARRAVEHVALRVQHKVLAQRGAPLRAEGPVLLRALRVVAARERQAALARAGPVPIRRLQQEVTRVEVDGLQSVRAQIHLPQKRPEQDLFPAGDARLGREGVAAAVERVEILALRLLLSCGRQDRTRMP